jgi:hypothetical protein
MTKAAALTAALVCAACNWRDPEPSHAEFSAPPIDSLPPFCTLGAMRADAIGLPIAHVLREPGAFVGKTVRLRGHILLIFEQGYFLYADGHRVALRFQDPDGALAAVRPTETSACGEQPVDVEGTVEINPDRAPASAIELAVTAVRAGGAG